MGRGRQDIIGIAGFKKLCYIFTFTYIDRPASGMEKKILANLARQIVEQ